MNYFSCFLKLLLISLSILFFSACSEKEVAYQEIDPEFAPYVSTYSSGTLSKNDVVSIRFAQNVVEAEQTGIVLEKSPFSFRPSIEGKAVWVTRQTIEFRPGQPLRSGQRYLCEFDFMSLPHAPAELGNFSFTFDVLSQSMEVGFETLKYVDEDDLKLQQFSGFLSTADYSDPKDIKKVLAASQGGKALSVRWTHSNRNRNHHFVISGIVRDEQHTDELLIKWDGTPIGVDKKGEKRVEIPPLSQFEVLSISSSIDPGPQLIVHFSDPLKKEQELKGLIRLDNKDDFRTMIDGQDLHLFPNFEVSGEMSLKLDRTIENKGGFQLSENILRMVVFEELPPSVEIVSNGVIVPVNGRITIPFEAVNLKAVDIAVFKVFEKNMPQFMQVNPTSGSRELRRVGELVAYQTLKLDQFEDYNPRLPTLYHADLTNLVELEPGAIYHTTLMFKPSYSRYPCNIVSPEFSTDDKIDEALLDDPDRAYRQFQSQLNRWPGDWRERDNPCNVAYFHRSKWVIQSLLATDIGITAKMGSDQKLHLMTNDLNSTDPMSGVNIKLLNFQQQIIAQGRTNNLGKLTLNLNREPFLIVASKGKQKNYLRLNPNESRSLSRFDVKGEVVQKGLKGYIYGDRGVWRPGDTLFLSFILEDKFDQIPKDHPVTFKLSDPNGVEQKSMTTTQSTGGIYTISPRTSRDAPTGLWSLEVVVGEASFRKHLRIETIMPNRLRAELEFAGDQLDREILARGATLTSTWLHGAPASNLKADVFVNLSAAQTFFSKFPGYSFDDPSQQFDSDRHLIFDGRLDAEGKATFSPSIQVGTEVPGMLNANFSTRVFEAGGNFSTERHSTVFHPFDTYLGLRTPDGDGRYGILTNDRDHRVDLVALDRNGEKQAGTEVEVSLYKLEWKWWWDHSSSRISSFSSNIYHNHLSAEKVRLEDGTGNWTLHVPQPDWGRYLLRVCDTDGNHCTGEIIYIDWPGWASRNDRGDEAGASMLNFFIEKEEYQPGEDIHLTFPSSENSRALITVENGTSVLETHSVKTQSEKTEFTLKAKKDWAPNVYVNVQLIQTHEQTLNDRPIRMYGLIPLKIKDPNTLLHPQISTSGHFQPEETAKITISEKSGKPMAYTLAIVDEGLLNITGFATPDPWNHFYAREALGVRTWDIYDQVAGARIGDWGRLLAVGGDLELKAQDSDKANRFEPVVKFFGPFELARSERQVLEFTMPNYVGSVRVMAVATNSRAYGSAEKDVPVKKPLMVLSNLPRVLGPDESVLLPVTIFAMEENIRTVEVELTANEYLSVVGESVKKVEFDRIGEKVVYFQVRTSEKTGVGETQIVATSGRERATDRIEIDVRNPNPYISNVESAALQAGQSWSLDFIPPGMEGSNHATIEVSSTPPLNLSDRLQYLIGYPHGCLEQVVSAAFPQLYLSDLIRLNAKQASDIQERVQFAINRVRNLQLSNGGIAFWQGNREAHDWATAYAGHFMIEANQRGYQVPSSFFNNWTSHVKNRVRTASIDNSADQLTQAYRLYLLALTGEAELGAMNRLRARSDLSNSSRWRLAGAYQLIGREQAAKELVEGAPLEVTPYTELSGTFGTELRDKAMILEVLILLNRLSDAALLATEISQELSSSRWMSTQTTAYALLAMAKFSEISGGDGNMEFVVFIDDSHIEEVRTDRAVWQYQWIPEAGKKSKIKINGKSNQMLFIQFSTRGQPLRDKGEKKESNIRLQVRYLNMEGREIDPSRLVQGSDFIAEAKIYNPGNRGDFKELALNRTFPSSWEIHNERIGGEMSFAQSSTANYQDIRDDRVYTYFDLKAGEQKTFHVVLNAAYVGQTFLPPVVVEAMYDHSIHSRTTGAEVEVIPPGEDGQTQ